MIIIFFLFFFSFIFYHLCIWCVSGCCVINCNFYVFHLCMCALYWEIGQTHQLILIWFFFFNSKSSHFGCLKVDNRNGCCCTSWDMLWWTIYALSLLIWRCARFEIISFIRHRHPIAGYQSEIEMKTWIYCIFFIISFFVQWKQLSSTSATPS